jgi:prepilin-type processing-associated H-X9-DG protein
VGLRPWLGQSPEAPFYRAGGGYSLRLTFGSPHTVGVNMCFCDGAVRNISYSIEPAIHGYLANRHDGEAIDAGRF